MQLHVESDASYLSEPNSRSRAGGFHYLGSQLNGTVECISAIIKFIAQGLRHTLTDLGHPQATTPIISDNACAVGVANQTVKQRRSKAIDIRYHWIRDRVKLGDFTVT